MRVLLVNTPSDNAFTKVGFIVPPLGIAYVGATLREAGHEVEIHDFNVEPASPDYSRFELVGISGDTFRHNKLMEIAGQAKAAGTKVMAGGPHVTFMDEETLREGPVDYIVRGEAEETAVELAEALEKNACLDGVAGVSYLHNGNFVRNPDRTPPQDLDALPYPARDLLKMNRYRSLEMAKRKITSIVSSRGCPSGCRFCASHKYGGRKWRPRSVDSLLREIRLVVGTYGYGGVAFVDDNFTIDPKRVVSLCRAIVDEGLDIKWWCFSRADNILKNPEMVEWMGRSGCRYVFMGIESADQGVLDNFSKKTDSQMARKAVLLLKKNKIETLAAYILGSPVETREMIENTIKFSIKLKTGGVQYTLLTPFPGTDLWQEMSGRFLTDDWSRFDCTHPVIRSDHLSPEELRELLFKAYRSFWMRPGRVFTSVLSTIRGRGVKLSQVRRLIESFRGEA
jgi:anaerobic magnesium-protoporphyrin IX monomethyl ester cyclase